jgi:predicted nuclease with RNAse H fold
MILSTRSTIVGVDVGGLKKGFHAVALREGQFLQKLASRDPAAVLTWCRALKASVIGIDAPCKWSLTGRARPCERHLSGSGLSSFSTPSMAIGRVHPFYGWMLNGAELFRLLGPYYRLFDGRSTALSPVCFETFPHAVACVLAGRTLSARQKRFDRRKLLGRAGIATDSLTNIDEVDAALCALTAHHFLAGTFKAYGDDAEGYIVVPSALTYSAGRIILSQPASVF